ncbi:unnamed protein product [Prorocentrum cordatum]|uniref:Methyltransferase FkbM domain-containing protein n=1 Tax=Prorocentrum cordatum TaxID=2364126 RepID=A0ABN9QQ22_9DINO|nr:unnamed protein product [Polarella glacialis]
MKHPDCRWAWEGLPDPRLIVEVGGNKGDDLKNLAAMYPGARIHSFEPVGIHFRELERLFGRSSDQVVLHHVGASDSDARVAFRVDGDVAGSSQFGQARSGPTIEYENVSLRDAHELFREVVANESRSIDVLSVNCEGCEYAVLERLLAKGWLDLLKVVQVSWHASSQIQQRVERRCALRAELQRRLRPLYQADFGWEGWSALPRAYAVDERFLGETPVAVVGRANAIPQAQSDLRCAEPGGVPAGAGGLDHELDPHPSHLTWPQTALGDVACEVLSGRSFRVPPGAAGDGPVVVEVGAGDGLGVRFRDLLALHPSARVHSFEPVRALRARLEGEAARRNATNGTRTVWGVGLAAASGRASFRVWGPPGDGWSGRLEEVQLEDAEAALAEVQRREGRAPDLVYLNCEGCEYEVLERLASSGRLASLPRLAVSWHAGGAPWRTRCAVEARLREAHTLARSALSWEFWVLQGVQVHDKLAGGRLVSARSAE